MAAADAVTRANMALLWRRRLAEAAGRIEHITAEAILALLLLSSVSTFNVDLLSFHKLMLDADVVMSLLDSLTLFAPDFFWSTFFTHYLHAYMIPVIQHLVTFMNVFGEGHIGRCLHLLSLSDAENTGQEKSAG